MESLHRSASQTRLKVAGIRCLPEPSQTLLNLRMLYLCGRWDEFWKDASLMENLVAAFEPRVAAEPNALQGAA